MTFPDPRSTRFGSGKSVRRVEDDALLTGKRPVRRRRLAARPGAPAPSSARRIRTRDRVDRRGGGRRDAGRRRDPHRRGPRAGRREAAAAFGRLQARATARRPRRRRTTRSPSTPCAMSARPSRRSSRRRATQARDAAEAIDVRYEPLPSVVGRERGRRARRAARVARRDRQRRVRDAPRRSREGGRGVRARGAHVVRARPRQPARDRRARSSRARRSRARRRHRTADAARELPDADGLARRALRSGARHPARARCASSSATSAAGSA